MSCWVNRISFFAARLGTPLLSSRLMNLSPLRSLYYFVFGPFILRRLRLLVGLLRILFRGGVGKRIRQGGLETGPQHTQTEWHRGHRGRGPLER
jgi:hypothetical protein